MGTAVTTKEYVVSKLLEMSRTVPLRKITMTSLAKYCDMNRGTLYYHFLDKQDLINYVFRSRVIDPMRRLMEEGPGHYQELTLMCLELLARDGQFFRDAFAIRGQNDLPSYFRDEVKENWHIIVNTYVEKKYPDLQEKDPRLYYVSDCLASGHIAMTEMWIASGMKESPAEIAALLELCSRKGLFFSLDYIVANTQKARGRLPR